MYTATFCVAFDNGGGAITAISTPVGFSTLVGTDCTYFAIVMLLTSSRILSLSTLQLLASLWTNRLSATTYLKELFNWLTSGLSLWPPNPWIMLNKFSTQSWLIWLVKIKQKLCSVFRYSQSPSNDWIHNFHPNIQGSTTPWLVLTLSRNSKLSFRNDRWLL